MSSLCRNLCLLSIKSVRSNYATPPVSQRLLAHQSSKAGLREITSFIEGNTWTFAKTLAHIPHSYVVRKKARDETEFERFVMHIRKNGYRGKFGKNYFTYFDWPVDGELLQAPQPVFVVGRALHRLLSAAARRDGSCSPASRRHARRNHPADGQHTRRGRLIRGSLIPRRSDPARLGSAAWRVHAGFRRRRTPARPAA
jgi:hypothetical protein